MVKDTLTKKDILLMIESGEISPEEGARLFAGAGQKPERTGARNDGIAVVGMAGRFADARDIRQFWENLTSGKDSIHPAPLERWPGYDCFDEDPAVKDKTPCRFGGFLTGIDEFDPLFFNISPMEAELMDPQQRLFLQEAWTALEDAGYRSSDLNGIKCGVFVGVTAVDYQERLQQEGVPVNATLFTGNSSSILAARISYFLNLRGPAISLDTACSSSLTAISLACESIRGGMCSMALAGGVQVLTTPDLLIKTGNSNMLAPDGRCKTFDHRADGFVPGEGAGAVVLKPRSAAEADGDHIYGILTGWGLNQDGKSNGITAPSAPSQTALEKEVYDRFNIDPRTISYIETHGTGTILGDPIEVDALIDAFRHYTSASRFCALGSVKTNIGHALAAAGIASFIKLMLCCRHRVLVPSLHFEHANPHIDFGSSPFYVNTELKEWRSDSGPTPRGAISSFGFSGTNAHLVVEAVEEVAPAAGNHDMSPLLLVLSAKNRDRLTVSAGNLIRFIESQQLGKGVVRSGDQRLRSLVELELTHLAATVLGVADGELLPEENLAEYGMDPVVFLELIQKVNETFQMDVAPPSGNGGITICSLGRRLLDEHSDILERYFAERKEEETVAGYSFPVEDLTFTLQVGREPMEERLALVADSLDDALQLLKRFASGLESREIPGMFAGNVRDGKPVAQLMSAGNDVDEFIRLNIQQRSLEKIARLWMSGVEIPWRELYTRRLPRRMSLPGYPFAADRYWIPTGHSNSGIQKPSAIHPLLDSVDVERSGERRIVFKKVFSKDDPVIKDHKVRGQGILPGAASLAMMHAAMAMTGYGSDAGIVNLVWKQPVIVDQEEQEVRVMVDAARSPVYLTLASGSEHNDIVHADATIAGAGDPPPAEAVDIESIRSRCGRHFLQRELHGRASEMGIDYGLYFKGLLEVWASAGEAVGRFHIPGTYAAELARLLLSPALLDAALQTILGIFVLEELPPSRTMMPFSVGKVSVRKGMPRSGHVVARRAGEGRYHVIVLDNGGNVCLRLEDVAFRSLKEARSTNYYITRWLECDNVSSAIHVHDELALAAYPEAFDYVTAAMKSVALDTRLVSLPVGERGIPCGWDRLASELDSETGVQAIYFFALFPPVEVETLEPASFEHIQLKTIVSLFRLLKELLRLGAMDRRLRLHIVTNDVHPMFPTRMTIPYGAVLTGFARVLAAEFSKLTVCCLDVHLDVHGGDLAVKELSDALKIAASLADDSLPQEMVIRAGRAYRRTIEAVSLPESGGMPFKRNGVYVIAGGAGGIGFELSQYLARQVGARMVLLGRSAAGPRVKEMTAWIEELGGELLYLQADITDLDSLKAAAREARTRFGQINGVVHSAIVLKDSTFKRMDEAALLAALQSKTLGSLLLYTVFKRDPLDFLMFFSSGQSYTCNHGQGNYAAGCTFKDAFALHLADVAPFPVKIVNWGYWGNVGIVAHESYNRRLAAQGIESIEVAEGMEAVRRILLAPAAQVMFLKASDPFLQSIGVDLKRRWRLLPESPANSVESPVVEAGYPVMEPDVAKNYGEGFERMGRLIPFFVLRAFQDMGVLTSGGESFREEELFKRLSIGPGYKRLFGELLAILHRAGFLDVDKDTYVAADKIAADEVVRELEAVVSRREQFLQPYPQVLGHTGLLWACADNLAAVLQGRKTHMEVMFPEGSKTLVEGVYRGNPLADYFHQLLARLIRCYVESRLETADGEPLRILEIGAGTGGTSRFVLEELAPRKDHIQYVYTDISKGFTRFGRETYGETFPFMTFQVLNIEEPAPAQGFEPGSFDVVLGSNVLHATRRMEDTLLNAKCLLKRGGMLLVNEATENHDFATLTFGLTDGWWRYLDPYVRLQGSPLLGPETWNRLLARLGFRDIDRFAFPEKSVREFGQTVIMARSDGLIHIQPVNKVDQVKTKDHEIQEPAQPPSADSKERMLDYLKNIFAGVLKIDPGIIDPEVTFERYGVDSLVGMEIIKRLERDYGKLPATLLFEHMTIQTLAKYFIGSFHGATPGEANELPAAGEDGAFQYVLQVFSSILKLPVEKIDPRITFERFGVDSLVGMDILKRFQQDFGQLPSTLLFEHMTVEKLASFFDSNFRYKFETAEKDEPDGLTSMVEQLPEREVDALLELLQSGGNLNQ
jgi:acyl transferase domain-containing protein/acyl carrier protein/SAM-dependent methyltransferase